jgi:uncharacterized damage-inducible protein DinB
MSKTADPTSLKNFAFADIDRELRITRRVLEHVPEGKLDWRPHEKSNTLGGLAMHVANLVQWMIDTLDRDALDVSSAEPLNESPQALAEILDVFDEKVKTLKVLLDHLTDGRLYERWSLKNGDEVLFTQPRGLILRTWCLNHLVHHRGQLSVYLRMLDVPVPRVYFMSADEPDWVLE